MKPKHWTALSALVLAVILPASAQAAPPAKFLQDAVAGDNGEVALGQLAQQRGRDPRVRDFGRTLETDHGMNKQMALDTARQLRIRVAPGAMKPEAAQTRRRLMALRGADFDRMFIRAMVADHRKDIAMFEMQGRMRRDPTAAFARETLPHLRHHLDIALGIQRGR